MSGNVGEWCYDWSNDYPSEPQINPVCTTPRDPELPYFHIVRLSKCLAKCVVERKDTGFQTTIV